MELRLYQNTALRIYLAIAVGLIGFTASYLLYGWLMRPTFSAFPPEETSRFLGMAELVGLIYNVSVAGLLAAAMNERNSKQRNEKLLLAFLAAAMIAVTGITNKGVFDGDIGLQSLRTQAACSPAVVAETQAPSLEKGRYTMLQPCTVEGAPSFSGNGATGTIKP